MQKMMGKIYNCKLKNDVYLNLCLQYISNNDVALSISSRIESVSSIRYNLVCAYSKDSNQAAHLHSLIRVSFLPEGMLDHWLPI